MKTQDEIVERMEQVKDNDFFGFQQSDLMDYLDYDHSKPFLKDDTTKEQWEEFAVETKTPTEAIKDYMPFAWEKANNCRGLSASRSIEHMTAWLWLDGKDELLPKMESEYEFYGKPCLVIVCREYNIDWRKLDDGLWRNDEDGGSIPTDSALAIHGIEEVLNE